MDFDRMLRYCTLLELNNDRTWFHENHRFYEEAKQDFTDLVEQVKFRTAEACAPSLAERLLFTEPKDMLYRIPRDMRIHKNQPPYNPTWRAYIASDRHALLPVGYFLMIAPGGRSEFGTGGWCPDTDWTNHIRRYIADHSDRFGEALAYSGLPLRGRALKRVPAGFDADGPAAEYVKHRDWLVACTFPDAELTDFGSFTDRIGGLVERMEPLRQFFDDAFAARRRDPLDPGDWE